MTITTEELQRLVDDTGLTMAASLKGGIVPVKLDALRELAIRVLAAEKMVEALTNAVTDSNENGREMVCYWVDDAKDALTEYESTK